jgi:hypothetical protein
MFTTKLAGTLLLSVYHPNNFLDFLEFFNSAKKSKVT